MTPHDRRLRLDLAAARYLDAVERADADALAALWVLAAADPDILAAFRALHAGLAEEQAAAEKAQAVAAVRRAAEEHLTGGEVIEPAGRAVTVGDVATELFRHTPDRLPAAAHALNDRLRAAADPLPADLALPRLIAWAEERFGPAPEAYWDAFRDAALLVLLRRDAEVEYQLAARSAGGRKP